MYDRSLSVALSLKPMSLSLRRTGLSPPVYADRADYIVIDAGREVGRIYEDPHASQSWFWSIIVIGARHAGIETSGRAATIEEAKEQFQANYQRWLVWANLEVESC
jgi:hypothetical protein